MEASADNPHSHVRSNWLRRHVVALSVIAGLLLLYTLGGFLLVPRIARSEAISYVQHTLGRQLSVGSIKFNPFLFKVEVHDLKLSEANGATIASLSLLRLEFNAMASLVHRAWTLKEVRLEVPFVNALIGRDGSFNLAELVPPSEAPPDKGPPGKAAATPSSASLPRVRVGVFSVQQGGVHFEDRSRGEPFSVSLAPIGFELTDFRTQPDFENRYVFTAASAAGERFKWSGQFDLRPLSSNGEFSIEALKATTIAAYLQDSLPCALNSGTLDLTGQYQFVSQGSAGPAISVTLPQVQVHTLTIAPKGADPSAVPWIALPEVDVNDAKIVVNEHTVAVSGISLQRPALQVWREADGTLNLQKLAGAQNSAASSASAATTATASTASAPVPAAPSTPAWKVALAKLSIVDADIAASDRSVKPTMKLRVAPLNLTVQNASSEGTQPLSYELATGLGEGGHLHTAGTVTLTPLAAQVGIELKDFDLSALQPYIARQLQLLISEGRASSDLKIAYADKPPKGQPQLKVTGSAQVTDFGSQDSVTGEDLITWKVLRVSGLRYQMSPTSLEIERVYTKGLYGRVIVEPNGTINISTVIQGPGAPAAPQSNASPASAATKPATPEPAATKTAATKTAAPKRTATKGSSKSVAARTGPAPAPTSVPPMPLNIRRIDIEDSTLNFADHSIEPNFSAGIVNLHGAIVGLSSAPSARAKITLDGQVDQFSPVQIRGEINPFSATGYTDVSLHFHNMELTTFNPYSGKYAGYSIQQGKLSTDLHYHIENRKLDATHHIVIDQLEFGAATESKQAVPLPIKLAVAILKDRDGVITLDLPEITGTIDDPKFRIGPLIWTFVVDLMKKVVTAPFAAIGALFGGGPELSYVDFAPGSAELSDSETPKLTKLSSALVEKPKLRLDIPLHTINDADDDALSKAALDQAVASGGGGGPKRAPRGSAGASADQTVRLNSLLLLYRQKFDKEPEYPGEEGGKAQNPNDPNATPAAHIAFLEQQLLPQFKPTSDERDALARARAQAVQGALLANKDLQPERVFLTERQSNRSENGRVRMELKLE
jgi:uncharacterized protein involved in outer membrane biogenesis